jgi:DNA gyrase inhibitor GyrI
MWIAIVITVIAVGMLAAAGCQLTRAGYESAGYRVVRSDGKFELRDYPALALAETPMAGGDNGSFMRLFRFISGSNQPAQKISMTTPVFMAGSGTNATMAFVMPAKFSAANTPRPADEKVRVREFEAGSYAVLRFSGGRSRAREALALAELRDWMQAQGLKELSPPVYGYFDPPWTLSFMRRNEVMLRTAAGN